MKLVPVHIGQDKDGNDTQWQIAIGEISYSDIALIASKFKNEWHVAVYGWENTDVNFTFKYSGNYLPDKLKEELLKRPLALRRILKVGVFDEGL